MADQFKYVINATLKLNTGSLNKLLEDVKQVDKDIKAHFEKAGGGVRVPLTADQDIRKLRSSVNRVVEGYNKGQAPSIKIPVVADEQSISKLQARIAEVRKQLNSLSDEQARVSVNTSLVVGRNEKEEVQKQVEDIKPTIEVNVIANEESLKKVKAQIEAIKAEVQATVNAVERSNSGNLRTFGRANRNEPVGRTSRNTGRRIDATRGSSVDRFLNDRKAITDEINTIQSNLKLLEKEEKLFLSANEIQKRIDSLQQAQASGTATKWNVRDEKGHIVKGTKTVKAENFENEINYYKSMLKQVDEVNSLKKQLDAKLKQRDTLERTVAYKNPSKNKPTPRSHISADSSLGQALAEIDAKKKDEQAKQDALDKAEKQRQAEADKAEKKRQAEADKAEKKRQSDAEKARIKVQRDNERTLKRNQQVVYNRLNRGRGSAETQDRKLSYIQNLEDAPNRYVSLVEQRSTLQNRVAQLKDLTGGYSNGKTGAEKRAQYSPQALAHVQSMIDKLNGDIQSLDNEVNVERAKLQEHVNKLYGNDTQGRKLQQTLLSSNGKVNPNEVLKSQVKTQTVANVKAENDAKIKAWEESQAQAELERQWSQTGTYSELPANGRVAKLMARNQARQEYLDRKTQSVSQAKNDFDSSTRRYGGNREYSGVDLEGMLKNPNVSLQDSLDILKNKINPYNAQSAYQNKQGFQKAYTISYKDDEGNIRNIRTLTYEYTKLGETIERGDKGFTSMLSHIGTKVGVFSLLEGAMFGVIEAVTKGIEDMTQFDAQLAEVVAQTQQLGSAGNQLQQFYSNMGSTQNMESQVQNDTFKNAETYGVNALENVMPVEQQVLARHNLVAGSNGQYDSNTKDQIVQKITQFAAITNGGYATPEETQDVTNDALSLYQAYYNPDDPNQHLNKMNSVFDNLTAMKRQGVNTTAVTDALAELAPDTITAGIDSNQVMSMMGAYNLSDASATGSDIQTIGRTFFSSIRHADTNDSLKSALQQYMGIDLSSQSMSSNDLLNKILQVFPTLNDAQQEQFAQAFAGTSGKGTAMTPKMVKFLQATQGQDYKDFMANDANGKNVDAMQNTWLPFSQKLKTQWDGLVEKMQEFTQLLGRLGVLDSLGLLVKGLSGVLDVVNSLLRGVQSLSDKFDSAGFLNIPKITLEILALQGAVKGLVGLLNKAKWGGLVGDLLAKNPISGRMGVRTTAQRIGIGETAVGETIGTLGPQINIARNTSDDPTKVTRTVVQDTEKVATKSAESATKSAVNVMSQASLKNSADSMLKDVLTFTTADVLANKLKSNPAMKDITQTVESSAMSTPKTITSRAFNTTALDSAIATTAKRDTMSTGGKVLDSVGSFMSDLLFIGALKGKGKGLATVAEDGVAVASKTGPLAKLGEIVMGLLPAFRTLGLLLGRLSIIGGVAYGAYMAYDAYQKHQEQVYKQQTVNAQGNFKKLGNDSSFKHATINDVNQWLKLNAEPLGQGHDMQKTRDLNAKMAKDWNLNYKGTGKNATISYVDAKGDTKTARVDNKDGSLTQFKNLYSNNGLTDVQKLSDAWKVSTDSMTAYANELTMIDVLSKNIAVTMNSIATGQKQIDAKFGGVSSSDSLQQKIDLAKKGLADSKDSGTKLQAHSTDINLEYQRSTKAYNDQVKKALDTNLISHSDIEEATTALEVAKAGGKPINTVISDYRALDPTDSKDMKKIQSLGYANKKGKITDQSGLDDYNTKQQALGSVLATYQQYSASNDLNAQSQDAMNSFLDQQSQYQQSIKQMTAQLMVAKLGLDAMNASLQNLSAVASASKTVVDINQNVLQTGDNSAQIGALHSSMQVSTAQMDNMLAQSSTMQNAMDKMRKDNPNQDFSLNALYDPQGQVTPEQMAYKSVYEQQQQMNQNIANHSSDMYQQLTQMRDLVLTSTKYADTWQRVQENVQLVKDSIKQTSDFQIQMSTLDSNAQIASIGGKNPFDARNEQLTSMRDASLQMAEKLNNALASSGGDSKKLQEAMDEIQKNEGTEFEKSFINPLNDIVKGFTNTDSAFGSSVNSFNSAVDKFGNNVSQQNTQFQAQQQQIQQQLASASQPAGGSTSSYGAVTNTGQSFSLGFQEKDYMTALHQVSRGEYNNNENMFVMAGGKYGVDPYLLMAIAMSENSGSSNILRNSNNVGNIKATGSSPEWNGSSSYDGYRAYGSLQSGINDLAYLISQKIQAGYNTIPLINKHYAEDPNWMNNVASFMAKMTGTSSSTWLGDANSSNSFHIGGSDSPASAPNTGGGGGGNGGVNGMFSWFNSVLNNTSAMHYVWGGAHVEESWNQFISKAAADCSGLVEQVYKQFGGIDLGTTNSEHLWSDNNGGQKVDRSNLQAGDMVFFGTGGDVSHVGIYAGNNQMYTIDHDGMPVTKENLWSDYVGGKHFNIAGGGGGIGGAPAPSAPSAIDVLVQETNQLHQGLQDAIALIDPNKMQSDMNYKFDTNRGILLGNGNIQDIMGTSGIVSSYDAVIKQRQDIYAQEASNRNEILYQNARRDDIISKMNQASASGDAPSYNELHAQLAYTDQYIQALVDNTNAMKSLDAKYAQMQQEDPRTNYDSAGQKIQGGVSVLRLMNIWGSTFGNDYFRLVGEVNNMESQYATHQKFTDEMKKLWDTFGTQTAQYSATKMNSDQDYINLTYQKLNDINGVMKQFAQGTQDWYSVLESAVGAQQQLRDLEQKRLDDAKNMYDWTGQGLGAYVQQKAYIQSRDYTQAQSNLSDALSQYQSGQLGTVDTGFGMSSGTFRDRDSAVKANGILTGKFGVGGNIVQDSGTGLWRIVTDQNLTQDMASNMGDAIKSSTQGYGLLTGAFGNNDFGFVSAHTIADGVKAQFGIDTQVINPDGQHIMVRTANQNISQDEYDKMSKFIHDQYGVLTQMTGDGSQNALLGSGGNGFQFPTWYGDNSKGSVDYMKQYLHDTYHYDVNESQVTDANGSGWTIKGANTMSSDMAQSMYKDLFGSKIGAGWVINGDSQPNKPDFNQQMVGLQIIADAHNKMTDQMNQYRTAVTDGFKAGALSIDDYISKLNQLRDVQTEQKENAVNMIGNISSGFSSALSDALTQGMQGSINSPLDFMNSIKSTLSSTISGQLTSTLLNNTGLQDVMNKISSSVATASTSGDPNAIVNMFNNNDFGKQMQDAIAPFLPMIQQLVGSTKGIFTILKDQVYNAPSGFKVDKYMNEVASSVNYQGIKNMNPNVNSVGSPILNFSSGIIQTTAPSQTPTGIPSGTSTPTNGTTTQTGMPENTFGAGSAPPDTSSYTNAGNDNLPWAGPPATPPPPPPAPAPSSSGGGSGTKHTSSALNFRSSPSYGNNVMGTIPQGAGVSYYGIVSGWAKVGYNGRTGYVGPRYLYHTGGIAGVTNFASGQGLKPNELSAILQKSETIFQPKQLDDLVNGAMRAGASTSKSGGEINVNVTVNFSGDTSDKGTIEQTVNTAVQKALQEFKKTTRLNNLSWKGTSY